MKGLLSQFGESVGVAVIVTVVATLTAIVVGVRRRRAGEAWLPPAARVLTVGAVVTTIVSTALPRSANIERDGDLVWSLGGAGLGNLDQLAANPNSLAAVLFVGNIVLYTAVAFCAVLGWYEHRRWVMAWCLGLSVAVETVQYLALGRVAATDDVLINMLGAAIGFAAGQLAVRSGLAPTGHIDDSTA